VLVTIAARKAADLVQHERRLKRGGGHVRTEADLAAAALEAGGAGKFRPPSRAPNWPRYWPTNAAGSSTPCPTSRYARWRG